ncbi:hypothetical protein F4556_002388 [Kitasatospora gansuensis]|uniref:Uncharacterized protein n=2 Tax=Kitasatospora TaxID=2063 RepID=A0A7W7SBK7_9ACTN|nr:hypothetical protein [Kitasatospora gansuensis]MBB4946853.1 hypothetical protein [Kitasatospora gansuensis]
MTDDRTHFLTGMRQFTDWLTANPDCPAPRDERILLFLATNQAVTEFATRYDLDPKADAEGNLSVNLTFGPIVYHVYGYVDFNAHCAASDERQARTWAAGQGLEIVAKPNDEPSQAPALSAGPEQPAAVTS